MGYQDGCTALTDLLCEIRPISSPSFEVRFETPALHWPGLSPPCTTPQDGPEGGHIVYKGVR